MSDSPEKMVTCYLCGGDKEVSGGHNGLETCWVCDGSGLVTTLEYEKNTNSYRQWASRMGGSIGAPGRQRISVYLYDPKQKEALGHQGWEEVGTIYGAHKRYATIFEKGEDSLALGNPKGTLKNLLARIEDFPLRDEIIRILKRKGVL